jgi:hypothetical protein
MSPGSRIEKAEDQLQLSRLAFLAFFNFPAIAGALVVSHFLEKSLLKGAAFYDGAVARVLFFEAKKLLFNAVFSRARPVGRTDV